MALHTRGFSFDRPLGLRPRALSKLATRVKPVNHAPPSYNLYIYTCEAGFFAGKGGGGGGGITNPDFWSGFDYCS